MNNDEYGDRMAPILGTILAVLGVAFALACVIWMWKGALQ